VKLFFAAILLASPIVVIAAPAETPVAVVVTIPIPPQAPRPYIIGKFKEAIPQYEQAPGLIRKYFTLSDDNKFGGIYLWKSRAAAQAWFNAAWKTKAVATYGVEPSVTYFDAPVIIDGKKAMAEVK
jgi:heme-degrading monooxygenase HmoA